MTEHFDVLIVGAGIAGIGAAYHLSTQRPEKSYAVLETKDGFGGTWKTFQYPGVRSDSDLYTFGYRFKPWSGKPVATGEEIMTYLGEVVSDNDLERHFRYDHRITNASWSSEQMRWTLEGKNTRTGERLSYTANFLWMCQGYYQHSEGYTPDWDGMDEFRGPIIHPQHWPEDLDYTGKRVVVIGSGATAATLIPAMAPDCEHITMLQRSPTYFATGANVNLLADQLRDLDIPEEWTHEIVRRQILKATRDVTKAAVDSPELIKQYLFDEIKKILEEDWDELKSHFQPSYRPWQQRLAYVPDGDLFHGLKSRKASVVTAHIDRFVENGILLKTGEVLEADLIVTATGFDLCIFGDIDFAVDGKDVDFANTVAYRALMFSGVPNMVQVTGYFRASYTLRVDVIGDFVCRLLEHLDAKGARMVVPELRPSDADMEIRSWVDPADFNPSFQLRSMHLLPKQGSRKPWIANIDYWSEKDELPGVDLDESGLRYA